MQLNAANITAAVAVMMMLIATATGIYQLGQLSSQVDNLTLQVQLLSDKIDDTRSELREEIRRSNQQLLHSLANHTHDADGNAVFTTPPGMEPAGANPNRRAPAQ